LIGELDRMRRRIRGGVEMHMRHWLNTAAASFVAASALFGASFARAETVTIGLVGTGSATHWPIFVGLKQGYYAQADLKLDMVFTPSSGALIQQLAAGSLEACLSTGIVDPIYAIDKGAGMAIVRIDMQSPPYALIAKPAIKSIKDLKGKIIMIDGPKGITKIYVERMLAKNGVKASEYDPLYAGATAARFAALKSGAVDATVLLPPFNFYAESAGFHTLGLTVDYTPELPFTASVVNRAWAAAHPQTLARLIAVHNKSMAWFLDGKNRDEAITIMVERTKQKREDLAKAYDFLTQHKFFDQTGKVSRTTMNAMLAALHELGDISPGLTTEKLIMPGVTQLSD
jgi:ABC-type nitrate/sulfonate/bicarbonate transport system substrate-binding protein